MEGHAAVAPSTTPTVDECGKLDGKELYVMGIAFALVPDESTYRESCEWCDTCLIKVTGLVGMTL
jgi:hypothetical protein